MRDADWTAMIGTLFRASKHDGAIFSLAVPAVLALAADPLLSMVDTIFVGQVRGAAVAHCAHFRGAAWLGGSAWRCAGWLCGSYRRPCGSRTVPLPTGLCDSLPSD